MDYFLKVLAFLNMFQTQLLIAELILCAKKRRKHNVLIIGSISILYLVSPYFFPNLYFWQGFMISSWFTWAFLALLAISIFIIWFSFEFESKKELLFYVGAAYLLQHLIHSFSYGLLHLINFGNLISEALVELVIGIVMYIIFYKVLVNRLHKGAVVGVKNGPLVVFISFSVFTVYILSLWTNMSEGGTAGGLLFDAFCTALLLIIQFGMFEWSKLEKENQIMHQILHLEGERHVASKENMELVNIKCHDLKYQISALKHSKAFQGQEDELKSIEDAVMIYDMSIKTGNEMLDIVLAERSLTMGKYKIRFSCIADGSKLNFIKASDLYTLFGNAMDNAIESVKNVEDEKRRVVSLNVSSKGNVVIIHIENSYEHILSFDEEGYPITTKTNAGYHGFGMRSMRYLSEKYEGMMSMNAKDQVFILNILFQIKDVKK